MKKQRIIVIGGLSAGPSAAAKARRTDENAEILLFEKSEFISYATCGLPYLLSGKIKNREKLMVVQPELLKQRFNIDLHLQEEVTEVLPQEHKIKTGQGEYSYDKLILATGASVIIPPIPGLKESSGWSPLRTLEDFDSMREDENFGNSQKVVILGGGLIGVEVAENLIISGRKVALIEGAPRILTPWDEDFGGMAESVLAEQQVEIYSGKKATEILNENGKFTGVKLENGEIVKGDFLLVSVGIRPQTKLLLDAGAEAIGNGALKVNENMETSLPDIYAAGDAVAMKHVITEQWGYFPMGTHSNKAGRCAGFNAAGGELKFKGAYGTAIVKIFDQVFARTGLGKKELETAKIPYREVLIPMSGTPGFYPDPQDMILRVYYHSENETLLGAQIAGTKGVDKRIDVLSTAIYAKLKMSDLSQLDLAYAPPFAPAKDPVVVAGYVAENQERNTWESLTPQELAAKIQNNPNIKIIDVRNPKEIQSYGKIDNALEIPLDDLRSSLDKLTASEYVIYCQKGLRGYLAALILNQHGKKVYNLKGGFHFWSQVFKKAV